MNLFEFQGISPTIGSNVYLSPSVQVIGDVVIGDSANIWFNAVLRGDVNSIHIGANTNIQDLSMLHVTGKDPLIIGSNVTVGHSAILHACTVGDGSLIGMGAKVLDGAVIGARSLVAAGSIVPPGKSYPENSFIMGTPAKRVRGLTKEEISEYSEHYKTYITLAKEYKSSLRAL